ncbi:MAG: calcium/sodium antiporter [Planctomycetes bacterium]|nr:calcium/sodium antiporter [Planctomycetota bacterium]
MLALQDQTWAADYPVTAVLAGLVVLVVGADLLVRGAVWIALVVGMSRMSVGLTLVAIGTSLPELLVSLTAARTGSGEIAMGNVLGSNVANTMLIIGAAAAICAIRLQVRWLELGWSLVATLVLAVPFVMICGVERWLAAVMVAMLVVFCTHLLIRERGNSAPEEGARPRGTPLGWLLHLALLGGGFVGLTYGADWLVEGAKVIAKSLGMSEALIGLTIVAIGTSLPELATSVVAAIRRQPEICIGNVLGSNIFNVGAVLGVTGLLQPFPVAHDKFRMAMIVTAASAIALVAVLRLWKGVPRLVGAVFLLGYFGFLGYQVYSEAV